MCGAGTWTLGHRIYLFVLTLDPPLPLVAVFIQGLNVPGTMLSRNKNTVDITITERGAGGHHT